VDQKYRGRSHGAAQQNRELVVDEFATIVGEDLRSIGKARTILLVDPGKKASDAAGVQGPGAADRSAAGSRRITESARHEERPVNKDVKDEAVPEDLLRDGRVAGDEGGAKAVLESCGCEVEGAP
jgi:hypothetical protein